MFEKRRAVRFRVPEKTVVALQGDDGEVHGRLVDLSSGGALVAVPPEDGSRFRPGLEIAGTSWVTTPRIPNRSPPRSNTVLRVNKPRSAGSAVTSTLVATMGGRSFSVG